MDDANPDMTWHYDVDKMGKYSTKAAWQTTTRSALASIGARFLTAGKLVIPNFSFLQAVPRGDQGLDEPGRRRHERAVRQVGTTTAPRRTIRRRTGAAAAGDEGRRGRRQVLPLASATRRRPTVPRPATATPRRCWPGKGACSSLSTPTTRTSTGSTSTTTRSARPQHLRLATRAASTAASPRTASCSSTRRPAPSRSTSAVTTPAPSYDASGTTLQARRAVVLTKAGDRAPFRKARRARASQKKAKSARASRKTPRSPR